MTELDIARRNFDRADHELNRALLAIRSMVPQQDVQTPDGRTVSVECTAWLDLYYSRSTKNIARFRKELPAAAQQIDGQLSALETAREAKAVALAAEKARKAAKRDLRAADAAEKAARPARPLARLNPIAAVNYDVLSAAFTTQRDAYAEHFLEARVRQSAGRVQPNVNADQARTEAKASFDAYVAKLAKKITSRITAARLAGPLWTGSTLSVDTEEGPQVWLTQIIVNCSVYRKLFNQWPTRRIS